MVVIVVMSGADWRHDDRGMSGKGRQIPPHFYLTRPDRSWKRRAVNVPLTLLTLSSKTQGISLA